MKNKWFNHLLVTALLCGYSVSAQQLVIKPSRTIKFTTTEGSYMDVDVSPNGKTLVLDLLGDLYTVPATGGKARQLTHGIALHLRPVWSPDGQSIAYLSDSTGTMHVNTLDLNNRHSVVLGKNDPEIISYDKNLLWTPDSRYVVLHGFNFNTIGNNIGYSLLGGKMETSAVLQQPLRFGNNVVYGIDSGKLCSYNFVTKVKNKFGLLPGVALDPAVSPDGNWLAYIADTAGDRSLFICGIRNVAVKRILVSSLISNDKQYLGQIPVQRFAFSPDSRSIYIGYGGKIHQVAIENGNDKVVPFTASADCDLGPLDYNTYRVTESSFHTRYARSASISPDGKHLVFVTLDKLYIKDLPNGQPKIIVEQSISQFQPCWSPDGKWIAYVSWCDTAGGQLWRVPANGGSPEQITNAAGQYQRPVCSPDGRYIAVIKGPPKLGDRDDHGMGSLLLVDLKTKGLRILDDSIPLWNNLGFSMDCKQVIYTPKERARPNTGQEFQLVSKGLDRQPPKCIATGKELTFYQQKSLSPDGQYMVYSADEDLYLLPVYKISDTIFLSGEKYRLPTIRFAQGVDPYWEQGSKILAWTYGNKFYRVSVKKIIDEATHKLQKGAAESEKDFATLSVKPDEVIDLNVVAPSQYGQGLIVLKNARIITMQGNKVIKKGTIVIRNGRIIENGPTKWVVIPRRAKIYDLTGKTIIPGLVDLHLHMRVPRDIFPQQSWMFMVNLAYGITTARDPSATFDSFGYAELLKSGQMLGPRLYTVGQAIRFNNGVIRFNGPEDARNVVQQRKLLGGTAIKQYQLPTRLQREWLLQASREVGLNMTNEGGTMGLVQLLGMVKDGSTGVEHNTYWGDSYQDVITFFAKSGTYFTPTLQVMPEPGAKQYFNHVYWRGEQPKLARFMQPGGYFGARDNSAESFDWITTGKPDDTTTAGFLHAAQIDAQIRKAGGRVTLGSHGNDEGIGAHNEIWALQMGGLTNLQALQAATIEAAGALGIQQDVGSIKVGKIADLVILNSNPLDDIHNSRDIKYVMKDGILYDGNTLDEIWPVKKKCPEWRLKLKNN